MTKCDIDGCAKNVKWEIKRKYIWWYETHVCTLHLLYTVKDSLKKGYSEIKIKFIEE